MQRDECGTRNRKASKGLAEDADSQGKSEANDNYVCLFPILIVSKQFPVFFSLRCGFIRGSLSSFQFLLPFAIIIW